MALLVIEIYELYSQSEVVIFYDCLMVSRLSSLEKCILPKVDICSTSPLGLYSFYKKNKIFLQKINYCSNFLLNYTLF